jgi:hypothetical protein
MIQAYNNANHSDVKTAAVLRFSSAVDVMHH